MPITAEAHQLPTLPAVESRHGINSIPELELMVNSKINYLKNGIDKF